MQTKINPNFHSAIFESPKPMDPTLLSRDNLRAKVKSVMEGKGLPSSPYSLQETHNKDGVVEYIFHPNITCENLEKNNTKMSTPASGLDIANAKARRVLGSLDNKVHPSNSSNLSPVKNILNFEVFSESPSQRKFDCQQSHLVTGDLASITDACIVM